MGYVREALLGHQGGDLAERTEHAAECRVSVKSLRKCATEAMEKCAEPRRIKPAALMVFFEILLEHLSEQAFETGPGLLDSLKFEVDLRARKLWMYTESELRVGRVKVMRIARGRSHLVFDHESCLCGRVWIGQKISTLKRRGPVAGARDVMHGQWRSHRPLKWESSKRLPVLGALLNGTSW